MSPITCARATMPCRSSSVKVASEVAAMDLFIVPTIGFDLLYALVIVRLDRRDLVWINVTANPTAEWVARQIIEAFPWDEAPHYLIRDWDRIYGTIVTRRLRAMGIQDKPIAPASPWQNGFAERLIDRSGASVWTVSSSGVRRICAEFCDPTLAITMRSERTGHWAKMRRSPARFSGPESSIHARSLAVSITITSGFRFSVHTGVSINAGRLWDGESGACYEGNQRYLGRDVPHAVSALSAVTLAQEAIHRPL